MNLLKLVLLHGRENKCNVYNENFFLLLFFIECVGGNIVHLRREVKNNPSSIIDGLLEVVSLDFYMGEKNEHNFNSEDFLFAFYYFFLKCVGGNIVLYGREVENNSSSIDDDLPDCWGRGH